MKRKNNEDYFLLDEAHNIYIVADGMGGHAAGEHASQIAVEAIMEFMKLARNDADITWPGIRDESRSHLENSLEAAFSLAHRRILEATQKHPDWSGMATTVVATVIDPTLELTTIAHVGDSRAYLIRKGTIQQITQDHSWVNEQIQAGLITPEEARNHRLRNVVTRAVGGPQAPTVDLQEQPLYPNDILLLCSDGLTGPVRDERILEIIMNHTGDLEAAAKELIEAANQNSGPDNITLILIACRASDEG